MQNSSQAQFARAAAEIFAASDRMTQLVIEHCDHTIWQAKPPGNTRSIPAVAT